MPTPLPLDNGHLTTEQTAQYWRDGYLFPLDVFTPEEAAGYRAELQEIEQDWRTADLPQPINTYKRVNAHCILPLAARLAQDKRVLDAVQGILGPDLMIWSAEFFIKEPNTTQIVGMHQDLTYWGLGETSDQVTAWIALSPATIASGCMDFVAGSHKNPIMPHTDTFSETNLLSRGQEIAVDVADDDKTHIELQPGQMSLHHGLTFHGSGPNTSDDRRIGFAIRYLNPNARQEVADRDYAMMARGVDFSGNFIHYMPPTADFSPESLRLYEKIRADQAKALAQGASDNVSLYSKNAAAS
ncbi:phytanoyl-CoA dioxygenase family protein [uncultured Roseovarius sp.]|uniref:phytanoyl-CoA dioxygenase family protein n=1 Tax=uncultured Roseovarius sp. TaxID=293344 RepID=UPI00261766A9|nr:phytanoyl-CoA dioxygenase family protein [uncultured Roseovarius sp.]